MCLICLFPYPSTTIFTPFLMEELVYTCSLGLCSIQHLRPAPPTLKEFKGPLLSETWDKQNLPIEVILKGVYYQWYILIM